jgi:hypothetical protein
LAALIFVVLFATVVTRFRHMKATLPSGRHFADNAHVSLFEAGGGGCGQFQVSARDAGAVLCASLAAADHAQVALAWLFVGLRCVHSVIHLATRTRACVSSLFSVRSSSSA